MRMGWCSKKKMNSSPEECKIPVLENLCSPKNASKWGFWDSSYHVQKAALIAFFTILGLYIVIPNLFFMQNFTTYKPEIRLDSLIYCPTSTSNDNLVIWYLRFDITNPNNRSRVCIDPFEVSIFFYNQTKLLTKTALTQRCFEPRNHTSASALADAFLLDPNDLDRMSNGTISFDLKIHGVFDYRYSLFGEMYGGGLVCGDAKVVALSTSSNSGCGSLIGDPVVCSYEY